MASDLPVALRLRGTVLQVGSLEHGVFAKALASGEYRLLATALLLEVVVLCPSLALERLVVDEKIELTCLACGLRRALARGGDVASCDVEAPGQQAPVDDVIEERERGIDDQTRLRGAMGQAGGAVGVLGNLAAVVVGGHLSVIACRDFWIGEVFHVIADGYDYLVCRQSLFDQVEA